MADKVRENRARRAAARQGLALLKSRRRDPNSLGYGGYMIQDLRTNTVVAGGGPTPYGLALPDVEEYLRIGQPGGAS